MSRPDTQELVRQFISQGKAITVLPPGKAVSIDTFVQKFKPRLEQRMRLYRTG